MAKRDATATTASKRTSSTTRASKTAANDRSGDDRAVVKKTSKKQKITKPASSGHPAMQEPAVKRPSPKRAPSTREVVVAKPAAAHASAAKTKATTNAKTPLPDALPVLAFADAREFEAWLEANLGVPGLWLKIAKKASGIATVTYEQALDVALCHGWIDGQKRGFDDAYFLQRFTPRRPKSLWSKINIGHVERLIASGRMRAGGLREIETAKADGRWVAAYDGASQMQVPESLARALAKNKAAALFFDTLDKTNRYAVCWRVQTAKTEVTRTAWVERLVAMLARGEKLHT
jgi:uncharacterized protein YdeI (YjbR/CyaY-like superfamily)